MQAHHDDFRSAGAEVVAVSTSSVEDHRRLAGKIGASFPILSDSDGMAIRDYGLLHDHALPFTDRPVARPAEFILDSNGIIRARFLTENWRVRERAGHLLQALKQLAQ